MAKNILEYTDKGLVISRPLEGENALATRANGNIIVSGSGDDTITGGNGVDNINAGSGNDLIKMSLGSDTIGGGEGVDTVDYGTASRVDVTLGDGAVSSTATVTNNDGSTKTDVLNSVENIIGTSGNDTIIGNNLQNSLNGVGYTITLQDSGQATVTGVANDQDSISGFENVIGSKLDDTITGNASNNSIDGGAGNGTISGGGANTAQQTVYSISPGITSTTVSGGDTVDFSTFVNRVTASLSQQTSTVT